MLDFLHPIKYTNDEFPDSFELLLNVIRFDV